MRLLVASNYVLALDHHAAEEGKPYPPLGTAVVAAALRREGHEVALYDPMFEADASGFAAALDRARPERVLLVADAHSVPQKMCLHVHRRSALSMIGAARDRDLPVVVSGPDASDRPGEYLRAGASAVIRGEADPGLLAWARGETAFPGLAVEADAPPPDPAPPLRDLGDVPPPAWDLVDLGAYRSAWKRRHGGWEAPVASSRGCPYRCNWCAKPIWGRSFQLRPPAAVIADCQDLARAGADTLWFTDDIFALKRPWLREFRQAVDAAGGILPYRCLSRADLVVRDGHADDLAATGCAEVWMGAESGSQAVLDAMDKDQDVGEIHEATRLLRARGVRVGLFLQLGYPGERLPDVRKTIAMVRALQPDEIGISVSYPLPGTPFYDRVKERMHGSSWEGAMDNRLLFDGEYEQAFYAAVREVLRSEHAFLEGARAARRLLRHPNRKDLKRVASMAIHGPRIPVNHIRMRWHSREVRHT
jgi:anaerobic magnesium-protoporphyrin IX monomethyl ester cyclase